MNITTVKGDLFTAEQGTYLAHCISADFALGAGIAKIFAEKYNMRQRLRDEYDAYEYNGGDSLVIANVFNLVTKRKCYDKPTYESLGNALNMMRIQIRLLGIKEVAMPKIGCGLDRLNWDDVYDMICDTFQNEDVNITIYEFD